MGIEAIPNRALRDCRPVEHLWAQYLVEKELAQRLRTATREERTWLYSAAYEELFRRIPHHSQLTRKVSPHEHRRRIAWQMQLLQPYLTPASVFLEVGAGDCSLSFEVAKHVARVHGVDVSATITKADNPPKNFVLHISDGTSIPTSEGVVTVAYSNQLMEHLHPDDAVQQLTNIYRALAPGGVYVCVTPNRLTGPHDISRYFDDVASGFHLREYTVHELRSMFRRVGFVRIQQCVRGAGLCLRTPAALAGVIEHAVGALPSRVRSRVTTSAFARGVLEIRLAAYKPQ